MFSVKIQPNVYRNPRDLYIYTQKYITNNFYISFEALPYPLQEILTFLKLQYFSCASLQGTWKKHKIIKKRGYKYLTLIIIEKTEYIKIIYENDSAMNAVQNKLFIDVILYCHVKMKRKVREKKNHLYI